MRAGVDPASIVAQLRGITDEPVWSEGTLVRSAPDALALALARVCGMEPGSPYGGQYALFSKESASGGGASPLAPAAPEGDAHADQLGPLPGVLPAPSSTRKAVSCAASAATTSAGNPFPRERGKAGMGAKAPERRP